MAWSNALETFVKVIDNQFGRFSNASLMLKDAKAKAEAMRIEAQGAYDAGQILIGNKTLDNAIIQVLPIIDEAPDQPQGELTAEQRAIARLGHQEMKKDRNIQEVVKYAAEELLANPSDKAIEVDEDLVARILDEAQFISKQSIQQLWGKILSRTILMPEDTSVDLIDFMRRLTNARAEEVASLAPFVLSDGSIANVPILEKVIGKGISYLLKMEHLGLIAGANGHLSVTMPSSSTDSFLARIFYGDRMISIEHPDATKHITLSAYPVTELGKQVFGLNEEKFDYDYLEAIALAIKENPSHTGVTVIIYDTRKIPGDDTRKKLIIESAREVSSKKT